VRRNIKFFFVGAQCDLFLRNMSLSINGGDYDNITSYAEDRDKVLHGDLFRPTNQNIALISFIPGDPRALRIHGCFENNEKAKSYMAGLAEKHSQAGLGIPEKTALVDVGFWKPWPPENKHIQNMVACDQTLDPVMCQYFRDRNTKMKELFERAGNSNGDAPQKEIDALENLALKCKDAIAKDASL